MDFYSLSRRQLQGLSKQNKIPANITNVAMADALTALEFVEGIEEIMNTLESDIPQSPMVPPTGGRTRTTTKVVGSPGVAPTTATRRRAAAACTSVRRNIEVSSEESLNEIEGVKRDVAVKTPAPAVPASRRKAVRETATVNHGYSTRRSARLADKIEEPKERSGAIKMNSFTEEIDENVEVEMKENSVDQSEISEITVLDNFKEYSLESEVKSSDETEAISEEKVDIPNGDVVVASIEGNVASEIKFDTMQEEPEPVDGLMKVAENVCGMETEGIIDNAEMRCNVDAETEASPEKDTEMRFNMNEEDKAFEVTEKKPIVDDETKVSIDDTADMTSIVDEDIVVAEFKGNEKSDMSENESSDDDESIMSYENDDILVHEVEIQDGFLNFEANHVSNFSGIGDAAKLLTYESDPIHIAAPLNNDELVSSIQPLNNSVCKMPPTVGRPTQISDGKENVDGGLKSVILKDEKPKKKPLEDLSMRELTKMFKEKMAISKQQGKECDKEDDVKATTTRPALKTLSDNCMLIESQH